MKLHHPASLRILSCQPQKQKGLIFFFLKITQIISPKTTCQNLLRLFLAASCPWNPSQPVIGNPASQTAKSIHPAKKGLQKSVKTVYPDRRCQTQPFQIGDKPRLCNLYDLVRAKGRQYLYGEIILSQHFMPF